MEGNFRTECVSLNLSKTFMMKKILILFACLSVLMISCDKEGAPVKQEPSTSNTPQLIFKIHFDSTLARLDNFGNPATIPAGNSAQSPLFQSMSAHYIELAQDSLTQLGNGVIVYKGVETTVGGSNAVNFDQAIISPDGGTVYSKAISQMAAGTYKWLRVSLTYQNYDIQFLSSGSQFTGRLSSFVGFNTYITNYTINTQTLVINSNKPQGYWGFETLALTFEGQAPGTTVPNPISSSSPIPAGSCVVTGDFPTPLVITGNETQDVIVHINLSTNKSFEWRDLNSDGLFEPSDGINPGDTVVDMGLRGLFPTYE